MQLTMQLTGVLVLLSSLGLAAANPPNYGRPVAYGPAGYGQSSVPWTSSTCSAVYSTTTITSSRPVTSVVTTTTYKPSTYTTSSPTVISSVTTKYKPAVTSVVSTVVTTVVGECFNQRSIMQAFANPISSYFHEDFHFCDYLHLGRCQSCHIHVHSLQDHAYHPHDVLHHIHHQDRDCAIPDALH